MDYNKFKQQIKNLEACYQKITEEAFFEIGNTATEEEIKKVENELGMPLPLSMRDFFLHCSCELGFDVDFGDMELPEKFKDIFAVDFRLSIDELVETEKSRKMWEIECFSNLDDERMKKYDMVWHDTLGFIDVGNGDKIAFDLNDEKEDKRVIYLSHDDGDLHGMVMGENFADFLNNLLGVGFVGMEECQYHAFATDNKLDGNCENAKEYRKIIGFEM